MHENLIRDQHVESSSDRAFGLTMGTVLAIVGASPLIDGEGPRWWLVLAAAIFFVTALTAANLLAPINRAWSRLGLLLGRVFSPIALGVLFYLVFTPLAAYLRATGKASMRRPFDPSTKSYWVERNPPGPPPNSLTNQF